MTNKQQKLNFIMNTYGAFGNIQIRTQLMKWKIFVIIWIKSLIIYSDTSFQLQL